MPAGRADFPPKDPNAIKDYLVNWELWLTDSGGDTIQDSSWIVPADITMDTETHTATTATIWLSGGVEGKLYDLVNHIVTANGREEERTIRVKVEHT